MDKEQLLVVRKQMRIVVQDHMSIVVLAKVVLDQLDGHLAKDGEADEIELAVTDGLYSMVVANHNAMTKIKLTS